MRILVTAGTGEGSTVLSAFDAALIDAGIANYNLIPLSSIVPKGATVIKEREDRNGAEYGHRLYVVIARFHQTEPGKEAWAGIGWRQQEDRSGIFVEHYGPSKEEVSTLIESSLDTMAKNRKAHFGPSHSSIKGIRCENLPVCAVVAAVYKAEDWE
jgi:arginine decarboxylase